jgi:hypothetical protein
MFLGLVPALDRLPHQYAKQLGGRSLLGGGHLRERGLELLVHPEGEGGVGHGSRLLVCDT